MRVGEDVSFKAGGIWNVQQARRPRNMLLGHDGPRKCVFAGFACLTFGKEVDDFFGGIGQRQHEVWVVGLD